MDIEKNFSQEIRNPVNSILGLNEMILRECKDASVIEYAKGIEKSAKYLQSILSDIMYYYELENGATIINETDYKLSELAKSLYNQFSYQAGEKGLSLELCVEGNLPEDLIGDEAKIRKILSTIINNAIRFSESGCIRIKIFGEGEISLSSPFVLNIAVSDTGEGIPENAYGDVFNIDNIDKEKDGGVRETRIGLTVAKQLCEAMGGAIAFESTRGKGTILSVLLPQFVSSFKTNEKLTYSSMNDKTEANKHVVKAPGVKLLVIDDTLSNLKIMSLLLRRTQMQVLTAQDGMTGIEMIKEECPDVIFLDIMMPKMDGIEVLKRINEMLPDRSFPVIALTANVESGAMDEYMEKGFDDYLPKPVDADGIEQILIKWLPSDRISYE